MLASKVVCQETNYYQKTLDRMLLTGKKPSYPPGGFCLYSAMRRKQILRENPKQGQQKLFKSISKEWRQLADKESFQEQARRDYKDYRRLLDLHAQLWPYDPEAPTRGVAAKYQSQQRQTSPNATPEKEKDAHLGDQKPAESPRGTKESCEKSSKRPKPQLWIKLDFSEPIYRQPEDSPLIASKPQVCNMWGLPPLKNKVYREDATFHAPARFTVRSSAPVGDDSSASIWTSSDEVELREHKTHQNDDLLHKGAISAGFAMQGDSETGASPTPPEPLLVQAPMGSRYCKLQALIQQEEPSPELLLYGECFPPSSFQRSPKTNQYNTMLSPIRQDEQPEAPNFEGWPPCLPWEAPKASSSKRSSFSSEAGSKPQEQTL